MNRPNTQEMIHACIERSKVCYGDAVLDENQVDIWKAIAIKLEMAENLFETCGKAAPLQSPIWYAMQFYETPEALPRPVRNSDRILTAVNKLGQRLEDLGVTGTVHVIGPDLQEKIIKNNPTIHITMGTDRLKIIIAHTVSFKEDGDDKDTTSTVE